MRLILRRAVVILACYLAGCAIAAIAVSEFSLHLYRRPISEGWKLLAASAAAEQGAELRTVEIDASDGIPLRAWYAQPRNFNGSTVLLLHGVTDNRIGVAGYGEFFLRHGYAVLLPDSRAHGESGGTIATYGLRESDDVRRWVDWIEGSGDHRCIYGFGESMGAGVLLSSLRVEDRFCAVIAEAPFADAREVEYDRLAYFIHMPSWFGHTVLHPVVDIGFVYSQLRYGLRLNEASPERAVEHTRTPVLLIGDEKDVNIPVRHVVEIHQHDPASQLWLVPGATHTSAWNTDRAGFETRVLGWFAQNQKTPAVGQGF